MESLAVETPRRELVTAQAANAAGALVLGLLLTLPCAAAQDGQVETDAFQLVLVPSTKVWLAPPEGFVAATTFTGFQHVESGASIMVSLVPGSFAHVRVGLEDPLKIAKRNMELLAREDREAGEQPGVLMHLRQRVQQGEFEKWMWVFGSENETVMIVGIYPSALEEDYSSVLRNAVLSARWDPKAEVSPLDGLGFSLAHTGTLAFFTRVANMVSYTEDGQADLEKQGKAMFIIGPAYRPIEAGDRRSFVRQRLRQTTKHSDFEIESIDAVAVDVLEGFEVIATAVSDSNVPTTIYQLILFEGATYWMGQGLVRSSERQEYLPMFRKMGRSFARDRLVFESENGLVRVSATSGWTKLDLNDDADLEIAHPTADCYLIVLSEPKADFEEGTTIDDHSELTRGALRADGVINSEVGPLRLEIDERQAVQYELHADSDGNSYIFVHTTLKGAEHFHQVLVWTGAAGFAQKRGTLDAVIASIDLDG